MLFTVGDLFTLCSADSPRIDLWTFSIAGLIVSLLAVDLPVFCLTLWDNPAQTKFSKSLLTDHS